MGVVCQNLRCRFYLIEKGKDIRVKWCDVDLQRKVIVCNESEKGSNTRVFGNISDKLLIMLTQMPKINEFVFGESPINSLKTTYGRSRKRLAFKLANPRLNEIHFHTLKHWKATMYYHYKPDMLLVAEFLGHRELENTRLYIQLEKSLFKDLPNYQFITRLDFNTQQACDLIDVGFEYITGEYNDGGKIFRKHK